MHGKGLEELRLMMLAFTFLKDEAGVGLRIPIIISDEIGDKESGLIFNEETKEPEKIIISYSHFEQSDYEDVRDLVRRECLRYALYRLELPYEESDEYYQQWARRYGVERKVRNNGH